MKNLILALTAIGFSVASISSASGGIIYAENFNGLTAGTDTLAASSASWTGSSDYPVEAGDAHFATNHLAVTTAVANFNFANWDDGVTGRSLFTASLDVLDPGGMTGDAGVRLATSRTTSNGSLVDLVDSDLADNTVVRFNIVTNIGASAVLYEDGITMIAANSFDVWRNGVRTTISGSLVGAGAGDIDGFGLWARRPGAALRVDNIEFRDTAFNGVTAAVPEPGSLAIFGMGVALVGARRRRR